MGEPLCDGPRMTEQYRTEDGEVGLNVLSKDEQVARLQAEVAALHAAARAYLAARPCSVCGGISPPSDGHDVNPPCTATAKRALAALLESSEKGGTDE